MSEKAKPHPTAYLDGLRGIAALIVFSFHTLWAYCGFVEYGYGDGPMNQNFLQLPFIRLVHAGHAMVPIFFVVGGYVMALKPLRKIRAYDVENIHLSLASSVFRKAIRLYLPAIIVTLTSMLTLQLGLWERSRHYIMKRGFFNYPDKHPLPEHTLFAELDRWLRATLGLLNIFTYHNKGFILPYYNPYDPHLWTLPFELRSTLAVALLILALSRLRTLAVRGPLTFAVILLSCHLDRWECALFLAGALLADLEMSTLPPSFRHPTTIFLPTLLFLILPALYLLSTPNLRILHTPGYAFLSTYLVPDSISDPKRFLHGSGAILLLAALIAAPTLRTPFETGFAREAGRRSYALYVVHGPLMHVVDYSVTGWVWEAVDYAGAVKEVEGDGGGGGAGGQGRRWAVGVAVGAGVTWVVVWVVAGWFERVVERWCGRVARGLEGRLFGKGEVVVGEGAVLPR